MPLIADLVINLGNRICEQPFCSRLVFLPPSLANCLSSGLHLWYRDTAAYCTRGHESGWTLATSARHAATRVPCHYVWRVCDVAEQDSAWCSTCDHLAWCVRVYDYKLDGNPRFDWRWECMVRRSSSRWQFSGQTCMEISPAVRLLAVPDAALHHPSCRVLV